MSSLVVSFNIIPLGFIWLFVFLAGNSEMGQSSSYNTNIPQYNPNLMGDPFGGDLGSKFATNNIGSDGF